MKPRLGHLPLEAATLVAVALVACSGPAVAQLAPPANGGAPRLDALLHRLSQPHRLLVIAAHPDDEDTGLLTQMSRAYGVGVAYLSLSRGEGGQNLIGLELGTDLGLLRTQELLAARAIDGGAQFFTRAYDFGFTRDLAETERAWPPDSILKDVVRVVRRFRPHVLVSVFSGTSRDGHGQHQMAGVMARRAWSAAGDPAAYPELEREEGLRPWQPLKLYRSARFDRAAATLTLPEGELDPATGRTYSQLAMESRSQHRSQDFGVLQRLEAADSRLALIARRDTTAADTSLFAGVAVERSWLARLADSLRNALVPARLGDGVPALAGAARRAHQDASLDADDVGLLDEALAVAAGVVLDARSDRERVVPGDSVNFSIDVYAAGRTTVSIDRAVVIPAIGSWTEAVTFLPDGIGVGAPQPHAGVTTLRAAAVVPRDAQPTQPYFLRRPLHGALYDWSAASPGDRGLPGETPPFTAEFRLQIDGADMITLRREVTVRYQDQALGEVRRPVRVTPRVEVTLDPDTIVWPAAGADSQAVSVMVRRHGARAVSGRVTVATDGWPAPAAQPFHLARTGEAATLRFVIRRPAGVTRADVTLRATAVTDDGERFDQGTVEIAYPHIRPVARLHQATARVRVAPIALPRVARVGYVRGASDRVPEALAGVGVPVAGLTADALLRGDLSRYDVIVIGSRAFETDSALLRANDRLLEYARAGGRVVVQYQQYAYVQGGYAPFAITMAQPHDRVTDETSPVKVLAPSHPVFRTPNRIEPADWDGWPQERGLYFANTWDTAWTPLLELADPGRDPVRGSLLVARVGQGSYIYTGLSFFRALPAGVPGAFRLFLNLLAWDGTGD